MRLYYYTAKHWGMKSLWERRLKIAEYADLNDPFELLPFEQTGKDARVYTKKVVNILSREHGVLCFSESWRSTLMLAHYGDKHKGIPFNEKNEMITKMTLIDINEKKEYGTYNKFSSDKNPSSCVVAEKDCSTDAEWESLLKPFMEE
jgi:hypothetical protein